MNTKRDNDAYWREIRRNQFSPMYFEVCEAMVGAFHKHGGLEAANSGLVNVEGLMAEAVIEAIKANGWLNDAGLAAIEKNP